MEPGWVEEGAAGRGHGDEAGSGVEVLAAGFVEEAEDEVEEGDDAGEEAEN